MSDVVSVLSVVKAASDTLEVMLQRALVVDWLL